MKSRIVAEQSIAKWSQKIEEKEDKVAEVIEEERSGFVSFSKLFLLFSLYCYDRF